VCASDFVATQLAIMKKCFPFQKMLKTDPSMSHQTNKNAVTSPHLNSFFLSMDLSLVWSLLNQLLVESIVEKEKAAQ
jgi:hypothetical protein